MLVFLDEVMKDFWLDRPALCHTHTLLFKQKSTLHFCKWLHVSQTAAAKKKISINASYPRLSWPRPDMDVFTASASVSMNAQFVMT